MHTRLRGLMKIDVLVAIGKFFKDLRRDTLEIQGFPRVGGEDFWNRIL